MAISIKNSDDSLAITNLGNIFEEEMNIDNRIISIPRPLGNSSNTTTINLFGKVRTITINGSQSGQGYTGGSISIKINKFIAEVELWVNASLQSKKIYTDSFGNTYTVLSSVFRWTRTSPGNRVLYTFVMIQGGSISTFIPPGSQ